MFNTCAPLSPFSSHPPSPCQLHCAPPLTMTSPFSHTPHRMLAKNMVYAQSSMSPVLSTRFRPWQSCVSVSWGKEGWVVWAGTLLWCRPVGMGSGRRWRRVTPRRSGGPMLGPTLLLARALAARAHQGTA